MNRNDRFACDNDNINTFMIYDCLTCGAHVQGRNLDLHNSWHNELERKVDLLWSEPRLTGEE